MNNRESGSFFEMAKDYFDWARKEALEYADRGDLKGAIDSWVGHMSGFNAYSDDYKSRIREAGLALKADSGLDAQKVKDFIGIKEEPKADDAENEPPAQ